MKNKLTFLLVVFILIVLSGHSQNLSALEIVKKADDKTISKKMVELHDVFHTIQGLCRH